MAKLFGTRSKLRAGNQRTSAAEITLKESILPICLVTILYFLWGFAYGLLDTLNKHFQNTLGITRTRSSGLQAAYFGAYPLASLGFANYVLRHFGYKAVFMLGLVLYGVGALCMWPAALHRSFGGFCAATLIIGSGLGSLETAANPFMAVCGPPRYSELRINIAQAVQAVGTVVGPVLGSYVFFTETSDSVNALKTVQWVYLAIAIFVFILTGVFFVSNIPEISDADMEFQASETHVGSGDKAFKEQYRLFHAAAAQFCYVGAQVGLAGYFINYVTEIRPSTSSALGAQFLAGAQGCFAAGRFSGSLFMRFVKPRYVFLIYLSLVVAFCAASITSRGNAGLGQHIDPRIGMIANVMPAVMMTTFFFESVCFPTIVALGIRGLGRHTKRGAGVIVAGVSGGAVVPPILAAVADSRDSTAFAIVVPVIFFVAAWTYAVAVNSIPAYVIPADSLGKSKIGVIGNDGVESGEKPELKQVEIVGEGVVGKA